MITYKAKAERLYDDVRFLTELKPYRNYLNLGSLRKVVTHVKNVFTESGLTVKEQKWLVNGNVYTNIIGTYNPGKSKTLVVGAHYDVFGDFPGADDNASAVAGLLETARLLHENRPEIDYTIELVAYCLEEPPFFGTKNMGSYVHAQSLYDRKVDVIGMICYEMIGYFSDLPGSQSYPTPELAGIYPDTANFIMTVGIEKYDAFNRKVQQLMSEVAGIAVYNISFPSAHTDASLASMSDQRNYWQFGYRALMINDTSFVRNKNYHTANDTIETLDFQRMKEVINGAYNAVVKVG